MEGLYAAVRERPELAAGIAPDLVRDDERLMRIFLEILLEVWTYDERVAIKLLKRAKQIRNKRIQNLIDEMITLYTDGGLTAVPELVAFLREVRF